MYNQWVYTPYPYISILMVRFPVPGSVTVEQSVLGHPVRTAVPPLSSYCTDLLPTSKIHLQPLIVITVQWWPTTISCKYKCKTYHKSFLILIILFISVFMFSFLCPFNIQLYNHLIMDLYCATSIVQFSTDIFFVSFAICCYLCLLYILQILILADFYVCLGIFIYMFSFSYIYYAAQHSIFTLFVSVFLCSHE